jgi:hypothetical protein
MSSLFSGTVDFYRQYRPGIPTEVAEVLHQATHADRPRRLLDIGTGTGLVVEALSECFDEIVAIDNDADMLAAAEVLEDPEQGFSAGALVAVDGALHEQDPSAGADPGGVQLAALLGAADDIDTHAPIAGALDPAQLPAEFLVRRPAVVLRVVEGLTAALRRFPRARRYGWYDDEGTGQRECPGQSQTSLAGG